MDMTKRKPASKWISTPNEARRARMRTLTLTDEAWEAADSLAKARGTSRSRVVESLLLLENSRAEKK